MSRKLAVLDLFSGVGGFSLGLERTGGFETVAFCEIDPFCRRVLAKHWPGVPIHEDIRRLRGEDVGAVDVVVGGFPCQRFSTAARGRNNAPDLWGEMLRIIAELRPDIVLAENVPGLRVSGVDRVCRNLETEGYIVWAYDMDTAPVGRQRERRRFIILAHSNRDGQPRCAIHAQVARLCSVPRRSSEDVPAPVGVDDGFPHRMDRLGALGNSIAPGVAELFGNAIIASTGCKGQGYGALDLPGLDDALIGGFGGHAEITPGDAA